MKITSITYGSNFGYASHLKSLKKLQKVGKSFIYSPNIKNKTNISKKFIINRHQIPNYNFNLITVATSPSIQKKICKLNINENKKFFLEKPLTENYKETLKLFKQLKKKKIKYYINFIFPNIKNFIFLKKIIKTKKIINASYVWKFKQAYFVNKKKNWKIVKSMGGGLVDFYLIHVFYNLLFLIGKFKIKNVNFIKKEKIMTQLEINLVKKNFIVNIFININSNENLHKIELSDLKDSYKLINKSKDWVKNFKIYKNAKVLLNRGDNSIKRDRLTYLNLKKLIDDKINSKDLINFELAHYYCNEVNKIIKKL
tara:strand:+ start:3304 stop:4239 length:936 start_codon:yes stop_codon:yes gene_type:complete